MIEIITLDPNIIAQQVAKILAKEGFAVRISIRHEVVEVTVEDESRAVEVLKKRGISGRIVGPRVLV